MKMIRKIAKGCFWISVVLGALGQVITFYPGAEFEWFALAAAFSIPGFLIPKWSFRSASLVMLTLWSLMASSGYTRGKEYQECLKQQPSKEERIREEEQMLKALESKQDNEIKGSQNRSMQATPNGAPDG
jgi:hypothetical protein